MPCFDSSTQRDEKWEAHAGEAMQLLCQLIKQKLGNSEVLSANLQNWWLEHKTRDIKRVTETIRDFEEHIRIGGRVNLEHLEELRKELIELNSLP